MSVPLSVASYNNLIVTTAMKQGVPQVVAKIIAAQAAFETGNFTSNNLAKNNNLFGMAVPSVRKSPYILGAGSVNAPSGEGGFSYAKYASLEDSVKDLIHWLNFNKAKWDDISTPESYDAFLKKKGYHEESQEVYTRGLRMYYDRIKDIVYRNPGKTAIVVLAGLLITAGVVLYFKRKKLAA